MPKKTRVLTKTLYTYVRPVNNLWARQNYKKKGYSSYSEYVDALIAKDKAATQRACRLNTLKAA